MTTVRDIEIARARASYLFRAFWKRIEWESLGKDRRRGITKEAQEALWPIALSSRSTLEVCRAFATRFEVQLSGTEYDAPPYAWIHKSFIADGTPSEARANMPPDHVAVRWDFLARTIDFAALRLVVHENPALIITFAAMDPIDGEADLFPLPDDEGADGAHWAAPLPERMISPRVFRACWTTLSPMFHGADEKSGNVLTFRREKRVDPHTGAIDLVPFISGNAFRGQLRDRLFGRMLMLLGMKPTDLPPARAHALFSGGAIDAGADGGKADVTARRAARSLAPAWDLIAGCIDQQIMEGVLRVHDAHLVCRENAWLLHAMLSPTLPDGSSMPLDTFRAALKPADDLTQLRLGTRHAHRDFDAADGIQMLWNTEGILPGSQMVHSLQVHGMAGVSELTLSCLADVLADFRDDAFVGAQTARGYGRIAFDPYRSLDVELPSPDVYRQFLLEKADEIKAWLMGGNGGTQVVAAGASTGRRSKKSAVEVVTDSIVTESASLQGGLF